MRVRLAPLAFTAGALTMLAALPACSRDAGGVRGDTTAALHADTANATSLSDPQVSTLVSAINTAEVGAANAALPKLGNKMTQAFAQAMAREHGVMDSTIKAVPASGEPMPAPPPQIPTMQAAAKSEADLLGAMAPGVTFDRAWIASQVADHQMAFDSLSHWRQSVKDAQLAATIDAALPKVRAHLEQARSIQAALGGGGDTTGRTPSPALLEKPKPQTPASPLGSKKPDTTVGPKKP